eukprot:TRINITY_DN7616_c0_g1_i1.p1 TRINITY_DN7616_c0_g1~~TRINITY_DN7616_c0_g1_i1.p1  ORF type:complete len:233 (+),score=33.18 TRINITY_DN7616_c0_g1_i1:102-701(+)
MPCHYIVNQTNWRFRPNTGESNSEVHKLVPSLESISVSKFGAGKAYIPYITRIPRESPLRKLEGVRTVIQIVPPNMNENKPDSLKQDYDMGREKLRMCYSQIFSSFFTDLGLPVPPKSRSMIEDVKEWSESAQDARVESKDLHFTMKEAPVYERPDFSKVPQVRGGWQSALLPYLGKDPKDPATQGTIYYEDDDFCRDI